MVLPLKRALEVALNTDAPRIFRFHRIVGRISARFEPRVANKWLNALDRFRGGIPMSQLRMAVMSGNLSNIQAAVNASRFGQMMKDLEAPLTRTVQTAGRAAAKTLNEGGFPLQFNAIHPNVIMYARDNVGLQLAADVTAEAREAVRVVVALGAQQGLTVNQQARAIRELVGLRPAHAAAPLRFAQELREGKVAAATRRRLSGADKAMIRSRIAKGTVNESFVLRMRKKYTSSLINRRALDIARTETLTAAHFGVHESWKQGISKGALGAASRKFWLPTPDERLSEEHARIPGMNPNGRRVDEAFDTTEGPRLYPPSRPNCRCGVGLGATAGTGVAPGTPRPGRGLPLPPRATPKPTPRTAGEPAPAPPPPPTIAPPPEVPVPPVPRQVARVSLDPIPSTVRVPPKLPRIKTEFKETGATFRKSPYRTLQEKQAVSGLLEGTKDVQSVGFNLKGIRVQVAKDIGPDKTWNGKYSSRYRLITIKEASLDKIREGISRSFMSRWHPTDAWLHTVHHEFGHALHRKLNRNAYTTYIRWRAKSGPGAARKIAGKPLFSSSEAEKIAGQVSTYARTNPREFIAETFSGLMSNRHYSDEVLQMYLELRGPVATPWQARFDRALLRKARSGR